MSKQSNGAIIPPMRTINFCVYKEAPHYVSQCLNVDVASFGATAEEAIANLKEAVELYFEDVLATEFPSPTSA